MKRRTRWIAAFAAMTVLATAATTAVGYTGQVLGTVTVAAQGTVTCDVPFTVTATIVDLNGAPVAGQAVAWSFVTTRSASDRINKTPTITNSHGVATTTVTLAAVSGTLRIRATAGDISASAVLSQSCGGLPNTSTLPTETPRPGAPLAVMLLVAIASVAGAGLMLRRHATTSR